MSSEQYDPRASFLADQEEAKAEAETRDATQWALNLETIQADLAMKHAHAHRTEAQATLLTAVAGVLNVAMITAEAAMVARAIAKVFRK